MSHGSHYVTRVEGHGHIEVNVTKGEITQCRWEVPEAPRFFESMVRGRLWSEMQHITSRICGICSISHSLASVKATEAAMGIEVSEQTAKLRRIAHHAENFQSHILHVGYLALPDLMGVDSVIPLAASHPEEVKTVIRLHKLGNEMSKTLCGRTTHPQRLVPGGFTRIPTETELKDLKESLLASVPDLQAVAALVKSLAGNFPAFERDTEYIALTSPDEYAMYDGQIGSTDDDTKPVSEYLGVVNEYIVPHSTAKYAKNKRDSYMVGALARLNLNEANLSPMAKEVAASFGLKSINCNSFMNTVAQVIECVHIVEDTIKLVDEVLAAGLTEEKIEITPKAGRGVGAVEAPRGILFHEYEFDDEGRCINSNLVIPTNQNHGNIQRDLETLLPTILDKSEDEMQLNIEMLVRAYDPCISCSTHFLKVKFVR